MNGAIEILVYIVSDQHMGGEKRPIYIKRIIYPTTKISIIALTA